jgi:hypothetical protein
LDRFQEILDREDEGDREMGINALKRIMHNKFVIKEEDFPESYFVNQQRLAREQGHGNIEIGEGQREQMKEVVITDQKGSLDNWIDYLSSNDAMYPDWLKYYTFRSITQLGKYDKLKAATEFASNFPNFISSFIVADNNSNNTYYWEYGKQTPVFSYQRETFFYALNLTDGTIRLKLLNKKKDNKDVLKLKFYYKEPIIY